MKAFYCADSHGHGIGEGLHFAGFLLGLTFFMTLGDMDSTFL